MASMRLPPKMKFFLSNPTLRDLPPEDLHALVRVVEDLEFGRGEAVWRPDDPANSVYWVRSGSVRVARPASRGRTLILRFHGKQEMFGIASLYRNDRRGTEAIAHEACGVYRAPVAAVEDLVHRHSSLGFRMAALWVQRQEHLEHRLAAQTFEPVQNRLMLLFQDLASQFGVRDSRGVILTIRLTHRELGDLVGATRETVSAALGVLRRNGRLCTEEHRIVLLRESSGMAKTSGRTVRDGV